MVFVTIKHTPDPNKFEKKRQSSLLSTTSRTADASYPSTANSQSTRGNNSKQSPKSQKSQQSSQDRSSQQSSRGLYLEDADFTLNEQQIAELSKFVSRNKPQYQPITSSHPTQQLSRDDLTVGRVIGMGGFGMVQKVKSPILKQTTSRPCVMKTCKPSSLHNMVSSVSHLMRERYFLSHLKHPHIVRMVAASGHEDPLEAILQSKRIDATFLILEYLPETLHDRIHSWREMRQGSAKKEKSWNVLRRPLSNETTLSLFSQTNKDTFAQQLIVALQVASALEYLHSQRVIFRDLKPANIGFDVKERVKLFDFGLATQLASNVDLDTTHALPGRVGTTRYMASEVLRREPYNVKTSLRWGGQG